MNASDHQSAFLTTSYFLQLSDKRVCEQTTFHLCCFDRNKLKKTPQFSSFFPRENVKKRAVEKIFKKYIFNLKALDFCGNNNNQYSQHKFNV